MGDWCYGKRDGHVFRWQGAEAAAPRDARPEGIELLTVRGWVSVRKPMAWFLWRRGVPTSRGNVKLRLVRACCPIQPGAQRRTGRRLRLRGSLLLWLLSPPLPWGAPRMLTTDPRDAPDEEPDSPHRDRVLDATASFASSLPLNPDRGVQRWGPSLREDLVEQARSGWERAVSRRQGIESRAGTFIQVTGLTTTVVLVNNTLISGDDRVTGASRSVFIGALIVASVLLFIAGIYGLVSVMRTFGSVAPDNPTRLIERARIGDDEERRRQAAAALLLAQRRASLVADWKLARLKRATLAFAMAAAAIAVASTAYLTASTGA
jgi:hypothetical protein